MCNGRKVGRALAAAFVAALAVLALAPPAGAHPLGNFTVNRYARVELSAGVIRVHYVLDEAEIPAFQSRREVQAGRDAFAAKRAAAIGAGLRLTVDGVALELAPVETLLTEPPGQGGLTTLRLAVTYEASLPASAGNHVGEFADGNEPQRIGWREIVVVARGGARVVTADVPSKDVSDELRSYPAGRLSAPVDRRLAVFTFSPGARIVERSRLSSAADVAGRSGGGFASLVARQDTSGLALAGLLLVAVGFGCVHALGPGHGKTVMAAYLVGTRGRPRDAVALGAAVSLMHTFSVLVLALVLLRLDRTVSADRLFPWLTLLSGVVVAAVGAWLLAARWRSRSSGGAHGHVHAEHADAHHDDHDHDDHDHADHGHADHGHADHGHADHGHADHGHADHGHAARLHSHGIGGRAHSHASPPAPLSKRGMLALAASGGLFPSPTAVLVLLSAFSLDRAGLGLGLVAAFSFGLAVTLTAVGLALVYGRGVAERRGPQRLVRALPLLGAAALLAAGLVLTVQGVGQLA